MRVCLSRRVLPESAEASRALGLGFVALARPGQLAAGCGPPQRGHLKLMVIGAGSRP